MQPMSFPRLSKHAGLLAAALSLALPAAVWPADGWQALRPEHAEAYSYIQEHVQPGMTYALDLADDRQYTYVKHNLELAGESPEKSPELYRELEAAHQEKYLRAAKPPVPDRAFATANSGELVPLNIVESFLPPDASRTTFKLVALSSYPDGTTSTTISSNLTYQKTGGGVGILAKNVQSSQQYADGTNFRLTTAGSLPADAANSSVTAHTLFVVSKKGHLETATHVRTLEAHATDGCLTQPMYPGQTGCLNKLDQTNPLVMCYYRLPNQGQDCAFRSATPHPAIYPFPIAGTATFDGDVDSAVSIVLTLQRTANGGGCLLCGMASNNKDQCPGGGGNVSPNDITISDNKISWDWTGAKIAGFPNGANCIQSNGDLTWMDLEISVMKTNGEYGTVEFSSQIADVLDGRYPLPDIDILDGCLARGTRIRLADGSERAVESFAGGGTESVRSGRGAAGAGRRVLGNTRGTEPIPLVRIEDKDGRSLLLTEKHPVVTQDGVVAARDLKVGDVVVTDSGLRALVLVGRQRYDDEIFNLKLDGSESEVAAGETTMYANGFLVGDARLQSHLSRQVSARRGNRSAAETLEALPEAWQRDFLNHQSSQP